MTEHGDEPGDETIDVDPAELEAAKRRALDWVAEDDTSFDETVAEMPEVRVWREGDAGGEGDDTAFDDTAFEDTGFDDTGFDQTVAVEPVAPVSRAPANDPTPVAATTASGAAAFLAEARERESTDVVQDQRPTSRRGRSLIVVGLAVLVAAQIVAGGVYLALRALDDDEVVQAPIEVPEPTPFPTPTPRPTVDPTATPLPSPTPVPPTPEWLPVEAGPKWAPFTFVATAQGRPQLFEQPNGDPVAFEVDGEPIGSTWPSGAPVRLRVLSGDPASAWAQVAVPDGDATTAWIQSADFEWSSSFLLVQVDVMANVVRLFEGNDQLREMRAATGARSDPTAEQQTWIVENPLGDAIEGDLRLVLAPVAGEPALVIESTADESILGEYVTDGRVLVAEEELRNLARFVAAGAKVEVIGVPLQPTPTPVPTPTPRPTPTPPPDRSFEGPQLSGSGCPGGSQGSPPNCYRLVPRVVAYGDCSGNGIETDDRCLLLGGDPNADTGEFGCPESAPLYLNERCYTDAGPRPEIPGPCPPGSNEVGQECREPVT